MRRRRISNLASPSPADVAISGDDIYVFKYTDANGLTTERWYPRFGELAGDHTVITLVWFLKKARLRTAFIFSTKE